jgi:hypothetical protein
LLSKAALLELGECAQRAAPTPAVSRAQSKSPPARNVVPDAPSAAARARPATLPSEDPEALPSEDPEHGFLDLAPVAPAAL